MDFENNDKIILRDYLALERTQLANERTLFAYIRTSLYLLLTGIALIQLNDLNEISWLGYVSFSFSLVFLSYGIFKFNRFRKKIKRFYQNKM